MATKRQKFDFSPEAILREIREGNDLFNSINGLKSNLSVKRVSELLRMRRKENDVDAASLLALMFGFDTILWVMGDGGDATCASRIFSAQEQPCEYYF